MKKRTLSLFLSIVLMLSLAIPVTLATEQDKDSAESSFTVEGGVALSSGAVTLPKFGTAAALSASSTVAGTYQWQINAGGVWVDIYGETANTITLTYAMVANLLYGGQAQVRCAVKADGAIVGTSAAAVVTVDETVPAVQPTETAPAAPTVITEAEVISGPVITDHAAQAPVVEQPAARMATFALPAANDGIMTVDETGEETTPTPTSHTILIEYVFKNDSKQAANPWSATIAAGSDYYAEIASPSVLGYTPDQATVTVDVKGISADVTYTVTYSPADVKYVVKHHQQNVNDDNYTLVLTEELTGKTESEVGDGLQQNYDGFYSLLYDTTIKIAADDSTVVDIYYDRYYYLMSIDLNGGYGVEPVYARYGTAVSVGTPTRSGYTFAGWEDTTTGNTATPPTVMPAYNTSYKALWTPGGAEYTVVFWYENADDDGYTTVGNVTKTATAGTQVSSGDFKNEPFANRDDEHFTYNPAKAETVTVAGDGTTYLNVYFTRNTYTITFPGVGEKHETPQCGMEQHTHSNSCCQYGGTSMSHWWHSDGCCSLGLKEHTHDDDCYTCHSITAKYDADITYVWTTDPIKSMLDDGYVFESSLTGNKYSFLEKMPGSDVTMTPILWSGSEYHWYYYLEVLPGMNTSELTIREYEGKTYYLYDDTTVNYSDTLSLTYDEDYYPITGFTQLYDKGEGGWHQSDYSDTYYLSFDDNRTAYLYYTRNSYDLSFFNNGKEVTDKGGTYLYQADISGTSFTPAYPDDLEPNAFEFEGWYTSPFFGDTKFNFTSLDADGKTVKATMPANDLNLYAHWVPVKHTVKIFLTDEKLANQQIGTTQTVEHAATATEPAETPVHPVSDKYKFVGWFYMDTDAAGNPVEKAFDFSMPVRKDLELYAKWSSNTLVPYTIKYAVENDDGSLTYIADPTTGNALAGTTKTFEAKTGTDLYEGYQSGYYPSTVSHSPMTFTVEGPNEYTFIYEPADDLPYTVKYLEKGTGKVLHEQKDDTTKSAVITETFVVVSGYMPDAYQKRLVLSADPAQNVIIFWYTVDTEHAPVIVTHWVQNIEGGDYTEYQTSTDLNAKIGEPYSAGILTIRGFEFENATATTTGDPVAVTPEKGIVSYEVSASGLRLDLYYDRIEYPYEFRFLEQGTDKVLKDPVKGAARYQAQVSQTAPNIDGYELVSERTQTINIAIVGTDDVEKNIRIFYYKELDVTINYEVVGPTGCGTVNPTSETLKVVTGTAQGSTAAAANENYRFVGWYSDEACNNLVSTAATYVPQKVNNKNVAATYYAKFVENEVTLNYKAVGPDGAILEPGNSIGNVDPASETLAVLTGEAQGSTATAASNTYRFVGWYDNEKCEGDPIGTNALFVPEKVDGKNVAATYYAKFEYNLTSLTIKKNGIQDVNQTTIYKVYDSKSALVSTVTIHGNKSVTIDGLTVGEAYTVMEQTNWSWRYTAAVDKLPITLVADATKNVVNVNNIRNNPKWLSGDNWAVNVLGSTNVDRGEGNEIIKDSTAEN